jgi:amino acid adenylation domain-containing protein
MSRNPVFQVMMVLQNTPEVPKVHFGDLVLSGEASDQAYSKFDMGWFFVENEQGLSGIIQYCTDLFTEETAVRMGQHFCNLLAAVLDNPGLPIESYPLMGAAEIQKQEALIKQNEVKWPDFTVPELFSKQVQNTPDAIAIQFENTKLTYHQLEVEANKIANFLSSKNIGNGALVPVCINRGPAMVATILGILKTGAAFVPVDPDFPIDRINYMLQESRATLVLGDDAGASKVNNVANLEFINVNNDEIQNADHSFKGAAIKGSDLIYVIFTSGSTGLPKGVMIEHRSVVNLLNSVAEKVDFTNQSAMLSVTTFSFDICYLELFLPLIKGACLNLVSRDVAMDGFKLNDAINQFKPTHMQATPATWRILLDAGWRNAISTKILIGGEAVKESIKEELTAIAKVYNVYGPTETTIWSSLGELQQGKTVTIGYPLSNTGFYILDKQLNPLPFGISGEICISGDGLARGYLNNESLTSEKFVTLNNGLKIYRTGDLGRQLPNGELLCLGRIDDQVKVRGYRVEPGEIESQMLQSNLVKQAVVVVKTDEDNFNRLVGYYIPNSEVVKHKEQELYAAQVDNWKEIYETEYEKETDLKDDYQTNIWKDSFTGELIPTEQMHAWVDDIVTEVVNQNANHVLEIGSGLGLIFFGLAKKIKKYTGVDFSKASVDIVKLQIAKNAEAYCDYEFIINDALHINLADDDKIDTILLNSTIQYFPGEDYLDRVIENALNNLTPNGRIIIGDVRDLRLLKFIKMRQQMQKLQPATSIREFEWRVEQDILNEEELCVAPSYFYNLSNKFKAITHCEIKWKTIPYLNELSQYRYTVILHTKPISATQKTNWQNWNPNEISNQIANGVERIAIAKAPNHRLGLEYQLEHLLSNNLVLNIGDLSKSIAPVTDDVNAVNALLTLANQHNYTVRTYADADSFKVNFVLDKKPVNDLIKLPESAISSDTSFTNTPLFNEVTIFINKSLQQHLLRALPDYMVPDEFEAIGRLPLTNNGKIDKLFLSKHAGRSIGIRMNYEPPVTEMELAITEIWQNLLGINRIGVQDNFFELGGHSLLAMRVIAAIRTQFGLELAVKDLFQFTTIKELSKFIEVKQNLFTETDDSTDFESMVI